MTKTSMLRGDTEIEKRRGRGSWRQGYIQRLEGATSMSGTRRGRGCRVHADAELIGVARHAPIATPHATCRTDTHTHTTYNIQAQHLLSVFLAICISILTWLTRYACACVCARVCHMPHLAVALLLLLAVSLSLTLSLSLSRSLFESFAKAFGPAVFQFGFKQFKRVSICFVALLLWLTSLAISPSFSLYLSLSLSVWQPHLTSLTCSSFGASISNAACNTHLRQTKWKQTRFEMLSCSAFVCVCVHVLRCVCWVLASCSSNSIIQLKAQGSNNNNNKATTKPTRSGPGNKAIWKL